MYVGRRGAQLGVCAILWRNKERVCFWVLAAGVFLTQTTEDPRGIGRRLGGHGRRGGVHVLEVHGRQLGRHRTRQRVAGGPGGTRPHQ